MIVGNGICIIYVNKEPPPLFIFSSMKNLFIIGNEQSTNRFENPLNLRKYLLVHFLFLLLSMLTCLIAILMLLVSLKTLVKREPLNIASLDTGYKSISELTEKQSTRATSLNYSKSIREISHRAI